MKFIVNHIERFAMWSSISCGSPHAFLLACLFIALWITTGPVSGWSDSWVLIANTIMTVISFLMMFLLQHTANATVGEMHDRLRNLEAQNDTILKMLRGDIVRDARSGLLIDYSPLSDEELAYVDEEWERLTKNSTVVWSSPGI